MVFYDNLGNPEGANLTEKYRKEREAIKAGMFKTLRGIGFSEKEISEVSSIIDKAEVEIQKVKDSLIGTNINEGIDKTDPMLPLIKGKEKIRALEIKMGQDIKDKVAQIKARKA